MTALERAGRMKGPCMNTSRLLKILAAVAIVFGVLTIFSGGRALFGGTEARAAVGKAVDFVLWFNFLAGFAYVAAGIGLWLRRPWAAGMALALALLTALFFAALGGHIAAGAAYEMRTVLAMALRTAFWAAIAAVACSAAARRCGRAPAGELR